eukprot:976800-Rhodomonas_salina.8
MKRSGRRVTWHGVDWISAMTDGAGGEGGGGGAAARGGDEAQPRGGDRAPAREAHSPRRRRPPLPGPLSDRCHGVSSWKTRC